MPSKSERRVRACFFGLGAENVKVGERGCSIEAAYEGEIGECILAVYMGEWVVRGGISNRPM